jgi:bla regulator protein BlaR1
MPGEKGALVRLPVVGVLTAIVLLGPHESPAQTTPARAFEVASIKPQAWTGQGSVGIFVRGNTLDAEHVSLFSLVEFAYNLRDVQLSGGPSWVRSGVLVSSELFRVIAKAPEGPPPPMDVFRQMLQTLLAERFHLRIHHEQKELPVYDLVVNNGGPKLKESAADTKFNFVTSSVGRSGVRIVATHMTVQQLIDHQLSGYTDKPIFDRTGLAAPYDFTLEFAVENMPSDQADPKDGPALVTAVREQLGLKLQPGRAQFDTVVIDHAERPTEN